MKATELRIGNLVNYRIVDELSKRKDYFEASVITAEDIRILSIRGEKDKDYRPIELTEDWLLKLGFEKEITNNGTIYYENENISIEGELKHVHQLQNLYFALTGEELKYDNPC